ncbi:unnamed protein product, partial [Medioppia subpectinata]
IVWSESLETYVSTTLSPNDNEDELWYWNKEEYPNPYEQPPYCRRTKPSFICDPDQLLTRKQANRLDALISEVKNTSACFCTYCPPNEKGFTIGVALIRNIFREYNVRQLQNAENFADYIRKKWNFDRSLGGHDCYQSALKTKIHYSATLEENEVGDEAPEEEVEEDGTSHTGLIVGLIIGLLVFIGLIVFLLIYLRRRFSEDGDTFQFKGMLSKGYWLNRNDNFRPVSVSPVVAGGGVYEPCSIEETNRADNDSDKRLKQKLSEISDESGDEEEIEPIGHNAHSDQPFRSPVSTVNSPTQPTHVSPESVPTPQTNTQDMV